MLPDTKSLSRANSHAYALPSDFCHVFTEHTKSLYLLALLLTADQQMAEQCFASALKDCRGATGVFKNWAHTWARRTIIQNAIRLLSPAPDEAPETQAKATLTTVPGHQDDTRLVAVTQLAPFERFVFVMSVLETYSDQECRILLNCFRHEVAEARARALAHIAKAKHGKFEQSRPAAPAQRAAAAAANSQTFISSGTISSPVESVTLRSTQG